MKIKSGLAQAKRLYASTDVPAVLDMDVLSLQRNIILCVGKRINFL